MRHGEAGFVDHQDAVEDDHAHHERVVAVQRTRDEIPPEPRDAEDLLDDDGVMKRRRYRPLSLSWITPEQAARLLADAGFTVERCLGAFDGTPFTADTAEEQIWIARKDAAA